MACLFSPFSRVPGDLSAIADNNLLSTTSGAAFLNGPNADKFVDRLWEETVKDIAKVEPALARFA